MSEHDQFAEDLALYALGSLQGAELAALESHLQGCASCRRELQQLRGDMGMLALASAASAPPQRARTRLLAAVAGEPRAAREPRSARPWWLPVPWFVAGAMALLAIVFWYDKADLQRELAKLKDDNAAQSVELTRARDVVATLNASDALRVTLVAAKAPPQPQGRAIYVRDRSSLIFIANNMPKIPVEKTYELWLIPAQGKPIPAGLFKPDARGSATVVNPPLPSGVEAKAFAITVEPEAGSATPTMPIAMLGAGE